MNDENIIEKRVDEILKIEGEVIDNHDERTELISEIKKKNTKMGKNVVRKTNKITENYGEL